MTRKTLQNTFLTGLLAALSIACLLSATQGGKPSGGGDASKIAFMSWSKDGGFLQIFVVDNNGRNRRQITDELDKQHGGNEWSSDGRFISTQIQYTNTLKVVNVATGAYYTFPTPAYPVWSAHRSGGVGGALLKAEDQLLLYDDGDGGFSFNNPADGINLFVRSPDGNAANIQQLTFYGRTGLIAPTATRADAVNPVWLPDGPNNTIRVHYGYEEVDETNLNNGFPNVVYWELRVLTLDAAAWPAVTVVGDEVLAGPTAADGVDVPGATATLVWDRQGNQVAFRRSTADRVYGGFWVAPVVYDTAGHPFVMWAAATVVADTGKFPNSPSFSPDGRAIAFNDYAKPNIHYLHIFRINLDNTGLKQVDGGGTFSDNFNPKWGP
jgi:hypothetical protein